MKFENTFSVQAPLEEVWRVLLDVERVAPCMPGAEVLERTGEDSFRVGVRVKLGPISLLYRGQLEIAERDEAAHAATMRAQAQEARGQGMARASVRMRLGTLDGATEARIETDLQLSGRAASMGRGVIEPVSEQLIGEFAANLQTMLAAGADTSTAATPPAGADTSATATAPARADTSATATPPEAGQRPADVSTPDVARPPTGTPPQDAATPRALGGGTIRVGRLAAGVIAARLSDPAALLGAAVGLLVTGALAGYLLGSSRRRAR